MDQAQIVEEIEKPAFVKRSSGSSTVVTTMITG
jgi:hypothetical protein